VDPVIEVQVFLVGNDRSEAFSRLYHHRVADPQVHEARLLVAANSIRGLLHPLVQESSPYLGEVEECGRVVTGRQLETSTSALQCHLAHPGNVILDALVYTLAPRLALQEAQLQTIEIPLQPQIVGQGLATPTDLLSQLEGIAVQVTQEPLKVLQLLGVGNGLGFGHGFD
jgi:hypothetical protein